MAVDVPAVKLESSSSSFILHPEIRTVVISSELIILLCITDTPISGPIIANEDWHFGVSVR